MKRSGKYPIAPRPRPALHDAIALDRPGQRGHLQLSEDIAALGIAGLGADIQPGGDGAHRVAARHKAAYLKLRPAHSLQRTLPMIEPGARPNSAPRRGARP